MLVLTAVVALAVLGYAASGQDTRGIGFHALYQFQLLELYGTFLTGDLFNLFVSIEILLIASYGLLLHELRPEGGRPGLHYVILNLVGSSLFLVAVGVLYGVVGTLNLADLAVKIPAVRAHDAGLVRAAGGLLLVVFGLKSALVPLHFWLPPSYSQAPATVAALFSLLTKAGAYGVVRVFPLLFGSEANGVADVAQPWVLPAALATVCVGALGALTSMDLRRMISYGVVVSVGSLFAGIGLFTVQGMTASLYYLIHSTVVTAALFLIADLAAAQRDGGSRRVPGGVVPRPALLGTLFLTAGVAVTGMPPLSGFAAKVLLLQAAWGRGSLTAWVWTALLLSGLGLLVAFCRAGNRIFWETAPGEGATTTISLRRWGPAAFLLALSPALAVAAGPLTAFCLETARQIMDPTVYISGVLGPGMLGGRP